MAGWPDGLGEHAWRGSGASNLLYFSLLLPGNLLGGIVKSENREIPRGTLASLGPRLWYHWYGVLAADQAIQAA